jgi:hypothetical protein
LQPENFSLKMMKKLQLTLILLVAFVIPCFAGFPRGGLFPDALVIGFIVFIVWFIVAHILGILTFILQKQWLRITAIVFYTPIFIPPFLIGISGSPFALVVIPMILFFVFFIIRKRK